MRGSDETTGSLFSFVDLEERKDSIVATLSGGMRTRVSLACAVVHRPEYGDDLISCEHRHGRLLFARYAGLQKQSDVSA